MSQLLDALRRHSQRPPAREPRAAKRPSAEAILATMGYSTARRGAGTGLALVAAAVVALAGFGVGSQFLGDHDALESTARGRRAPADAVRARPASENRDSTSRSSGSAPVNSLSVSQAAENRDVPPRPAAARRRDAVVNTPAMRFQAAVDLQRAGRLDEAARAYEDLIAQNAVAVEAHNNLGLLDQERGELDRAVRHFELALELDSRYVNAHNNLGVALLALGRVDAAARRFQRAAELAPGDADALVNLALADKAAGRTEQAMESLLRALGLAPDNAAAHYNLAVLYDRSGEATRAVEHYRAFLDHSRAEHAARVVDVRARLRALDRLR